MTTCFLAPDPVQSTFFIPGGAVPGNGVQVFFYQAGTTTKQTAYKDNAAGSSWTNPIVLDSGGNLPSGGSVWFPQGQTFKVVWAPSNDTDPPASPYRTLDNVSGVNDVSASVVTSEWIATTSSPAFIGTTTFSIAGNQTSVFTTGRRIKTTNTAGTVYSTVFSSAFGGSSTQVVVVNDATSVLDSGLSAVSYSILNAGNDGVPVLPSGRALFMDATDKTKRASVTVSSVASSAVVPIVVTPGGIQGATKVFLSRKEANVSSNISFTTSDASFTDYKEYEVTIDASRPTSVGGDSLRMMFSEDGGATYKSTNGNYNTVMSLSAVLTSSAFSSITFATRNAADIRFVDQALSQGSVTGLPYLYAHVKLPNLSSTTGPKNVNITDVSYTQFSTFALVAGYVVSAYTSDTNAVNALQFSYVTGNISTGAFTLYGLKTT